MPNYFSENKIKNEVLEYSGMIWSGIYKRNIFDVVRFPEGYWFEDIISRMIIYRMGSFKSIDNVLYHKRKHDNNASIVVWSSSNYKSIDHLYLVINYYEICKKLSLIDGTYFRLIAHELGCYLYWRIKGLNKKDQISVFYYACDFINSIEYSYDELSKLEKEIIISLKNKNYKRWKLLSIKDWSSTKE